MGTVPRLAIAALLAFTLAGCSESPVGDAPATSPRAASEAPSGRTTERADAGTIEARVTYAGAPVVETIKVNKDVEQCGTEACIEKIAVGAGQGLAHAVVSVAGLDGRRARSRS